MGFDSKPLILAHQALQRGNLEALDGVMAKALNQAPSGKHVERIKQVRRYFKDHWTGLLDWRQGQTPGEERGLGASEAEINHVLAVRMKKRGMSWTEEGTHHMAQMRCLLAMDQLQAWLADYQQKRWPHISLGNWAELQSRVYRTAPQDRSGGLVTRPDSDSGHGCRFLASCREALNALSRLRPQVAQSASHT